MKKIFEIYYDESEDSCEARFVESDFAFSEELVAGIIATVAYVFQTAVDLRDREQFMAKLSDLVMQEFRDGELEGRIEVDA
jgi:hypothetical protein